jgi:hypothetical protein
MAMFNTRAWLTRGPNPDGPGTVPAVEHVTRAYPEPFFKYLLQKLEKWQILDRSRTVAISCNALLANEIRHKHHVIEEINADIQRHRMPDRVSRLVRDLKVKLTLKYMHLDMDWIRSYIRDHHRSSMGEGHLWNAAFDITKEEWRTIMEIHKSNLERLLLYDKPVYNDIRFYIGNRARSGSFEHGFSEKVHEVITRTRLITFHPALSTWTLFIPQKAAWYTEYFKALEEEFHIAGKYYYPYVLGGKVYLEFKNLYKDHIFSAYDGRTWDGSAALLNGRYNECFAIDLLGHPMIPSGISTTSMDDTTANMWVTRDVDAHKFILGDDLNILSKHPVTLTKMGFFEYQDVDSRNGYFLGVAWRPTAEERRRGLLVAKTIGIARISTDSPRHARPLRLDENESTPYVRRLDNRIRSTVVGLAFGKFGNGTLESRLERIKPGEFIAPHELLENIAEDSLTREIGDPYAWAEEQGVKALFT